MSSVPKDQKESKKDVKPRRSHIIDAFQIIGATTAEKDCFLEALGLDLELYHSRLVELHKQKILISTDAVSFSKATRFYLDMEKYNALRSKEDKDFFIKLLAIVIPGILFGLLGIIWLL